MAGCFRLPIPRKEKARWLPGEESLLQIKAARRKSPALPGPGTGATESLRPAFPVAFAFSPGGRLPPRMMGVG